MVVEHARQPERTQPLPHDLLRPNSRRLTAMALSSCPRRSSTLTGPEPWPGASGADPLTPNGTPMRHGVTISKIQNGLFKLRVAN